MLRNIDFSLFCPSCNHVSMYFILLGMTMYLFAWNHARPCCVSLVILWRFESIITLCFTANTVQMVSLRMLHRLESILIKHAFIFYSLISNVFNWKTKTTSKQERKLFEHWNIPSIRVMSLPLFTMNVLINEREWFIQLDLKVV